MSKIFSGFVIFLVAITFSVYTNAQEYITTSIDNQENITQPILPLTQSENSIFHENSIISENIVSTYQVEYYTPVQNVAKRVACRSRFAVQRVGNGARRVSQRVANRSRFAVQRVGNVARRVSQRVQFFGQRVKSRAKFAATRARARFNYRWQ